MDGPQIRVLAGEYTLQHGATYKTYESPSTEQLHQQKFRKIASPFGNSIAAVRELYRISSQQQQSNKGKRYRLNQQLPKNQRYFPLQFKITCGGKQTLGCKAYSIYQFNQKHHCYFLKEAINQHYHKIEQKRYSKYNDRYQIKEENQELKYFTYMDPQEIKKQIIKQKNKQNWTKSNRKKSRLRKIEKDRKNLLNNKDYRRFLSNVQRKQKKVIVGNENIEENGEISEFKFEDDE